MHPQAHVADAPRDQLLALRSFAFDRLAAMAVVLDGAGTIIDTNEAWRLSARLNDASALTTGPGLNYLDICDHAAAAGAEGAAAVAGGLRQIISGERDHFDLEYPCPSPTEDRWFLLQASSAPVADGAGVVLFHVDVTARRALQDQVVAGTGRDELTGLPNRWSAARFLAAELADGGDGAGAPVLVLSVGVDGLDQVRDTHGRHIGDELLVRVAARARRSVRQGDLLCRLAGDEFALVCPDLDEAGAWVVAARLRDAMSRPFQFDSTEVVAAASVAFASSHAASTADSLLDAAGAARRAGATDAGSDVVPGGGGAPVEPAPAPDRREDLLVELQRARAMAGAIVARSNDLVGRNGLEMIHPEDRDRVLADFCTVTQLGDHVRTEFRVVDLEGQVRWVEEIATNLIDDPSVGVIVGNLRDITDRKHAEEAVRFQARLLAAVGQAIVAVDTAGTVIYWNDAAQATYGWTAEETLGQPISTVLRPEAGWGSRADEVRLPLSDGQPWVGELRVGTKAGGEIPVVVTDTPVFDEDGAHVATIGMSIDISDRLRNDETAALLSSIVQSSTDAIFSCSVDGTITTWNAGAEALYGHAGPDLTGMHVSCLVPPAHVGTLHALIERVRRGEIVQNLQALARRATGEDVHVSVAISPVHDAAGSIVGASAIIRDVSECVELRQRIEEDHRRLAEAQASAGLGSFELDLETGHLTCSDEFWRIVGLDPASPDDLIYDHTHPEDRDLVHQAMAEALAGRPAAECTHRIVRADGEVRWVTSRTSRFTVPGSRVLSGTMLDITERHLAELALAHQAGHDRLTGLPNRAGLSDGLNALLGDPGSLRPRVAVAFLDLDRFKVINDTHSHAVGDATLVAVAHRLRAGLRPTDLVLRTDGQRWRHPVGPRSLTRFSPAGRRCRHVPGQGGRPGPYHGVRRRLPGPGLPIGDWVLDRALGQLATWHDDPAIRDDLWMAVNLSAPQLGQASLVDRVAGVIAAAGLPAGLVHLEITESVLMDRVEHSLEALVALRALGVHISIDDFGTGYSSLSYLNRLPVDILKVDRSFVDGLGSGYHHTSIVGALTTLADTLGLLVVAEGIERPEQLRILQELGCTFGQGFLWSGSLQPDEARAWLLAATDGGTAARKC